MKTGTLFTKNGLELPCVILPVERPLFPFGKEVIVYCQNRLIKGLFDDEDIIVEMEEVVDFCIIPELSELIKEVKVCLESD